MAGDWIKWEKGLAGKPEVLRMAAALNRSPAEVAGACMMLWEWADSNVGEDGTAKGLTVETLAALQDRCSGVTHLCAQLVAVGWLRVTETGVEFVNYCRHNGHTSKIRAQTKDRLKRFRNAPSVSSALPEKRREEKSIHTQPPAPLQAATTAPGETPAPKRFTPPTVEDVKAFAAQYGVVLNAEEFTDYYASKGWKVGNVPMKDWKAAARNWARRDARGGQAKARPLSWGEIEEQAAAERKAKEQKRSASLLDAQERANRDADAAAAAIRAQRAVDDADLAKALADRDALGRYESEKLPELSPLLQTAWDQDGPTNTAAKAEYLAWWRQQGKG